MVGLGIACVAVYDVVPAIGSVIGICALFLSSLSITTRRDVAFIILCGSRARYRAAKKGWNDEPEDSLARFLVGDDFARVANVSARFVSRCWSQIEALAVGAEAAAA